jgi:predicted dehydrogenase
MNLLPVTEIGTGKLRLGFAGAGWIGKNRMQALEDSGLATIAALAAPSPSDDLAETASSARYYSDFAIQGARAFYRSMDGR